MTAPADNPSSAPGSDEQPPAFPADRRTAAFPDPHRDVARWRTVSDADIDAIHAVLVAAGRIDHPQYTAPREDVEEILSFSHVDLARDVVVAEGHDGRLLAVGACLLHPARDERLRVDLVGAVDPAVRGRGIGAALIDWQVVRGRELVAAARREGGDSLEAALHVHADENQVSCVALAEGRGFTTERWFSTMHRDLTAPISPREDPDGVRTVAFSDDWTEAARTAKNDSFRDHWGSLPTTPEYWNTFTTRAQFRSELSMLVIEDERVLAFALVSVNEADWAALGKSNGYIELVGVIRDGRGRGLAPLVLTRTLESMARAGLEVAVLDVDTASPTGANTLYERLGFDLRERSSVLVLPVPES